MMMLTTAIPVCSHSAHRTQYDRLLQQQLTDVLVLLVVAVISWSLEFEISGGIGMGVRKSLSALILSIHSGEVIVERQ